MAQTATRPPAEKDIERLLFIAVILLMAMAGFLIWIIEYYQWPGIWKAVQSALINIFTSTVGFFAAFSLLRNYNERGQRQLIDDGLKSRTTDLNEKIARLESGLINESRHTREAILSLGSWKDHFVLLKDLPYDVLFKKAREVALLVQSWERWVEERDKELLDLVRQGGKFVLVIHNPDNERVIAASTSRWKLRKMDQRSQIANTIAILERTIPPGQLRVIKRDDVIWYCALRFTYDSPDDTVYILSPYAHQDFAVAQIPAFVVKRSLTPHIAEFFDREWTRLIG